MKKHLWIKQFCSQKKYFVIFERTSIHNAWPKQYEYASCIFVNFENKRTCDKFPLYGTPYTGGDKNAVWWTNSNIVKQFSNFQTFEGFKNIQ